MRVAGRATKRSWSTPWCATTTSPRGCDERAQAVGGVVAHADDDAAARAPTARIMRRKYDDLAALVPLGMVEEREVVHRSRRTATVARSGIV